MQISFKRQVKASLSYSFKIVTTFHFFPPNKADLIWYIKPIGSYIKPQQSYKTNNAAFSKCVNKVFPKANINQNKAQMWKIYFLPFFPVLTVPVLAFTTIFLVYNSFVSLTLTLQISFRLSPSLGPIPIDTMWCLMYILAIYYLYFLCLIHRHTSFYCTLLYWALQMLLFLFFTNWRFVATLHRASLLVPFFQQQLLTLCLCVTFW